MSTQPLIAYEIDLMRQMHVPEPPPNDDELALCADCRRVYPCAMIRALDELATLRTQHAAAPLTDERRRDWLEAIAHTARLMLERAWDDPVQQELRELLADELANLVALGEVSP